MHEIPLYPLRFEPIYQYRLWGGQRLADLLSMPIPSGEPIGEAWILSDRDDHQSVVANGPLTGQTIGRLMERHRAQLMGSSRRASAAFRCCSSFLMRTKCFPCRFIPATRILA